MSTKITSTELTALASVPYVGRKTVRTILEYLNKHELSFAYLWGKMPEKHTNLLFDKRQINSINKFKKEYKISSYQSWLESQGITPITLLDDEYPHWLKFTTDSPILLYAKGNTKLLKSTKMIAVVGTRKLTSYGRMAAIKLTRELCDYGAVIVSGFMYGADAMAHKTAIQNDAGTVGVLGYGFNHLYPKHQRQLFDEIIDNDGVFISEFTPETEPRAGHFPVRNRIIAGMSQAVLVIEAAKRSGTSITARCALDEGRTVCAVPGPINSPFSEGTKNLLNQGAVLVTSGRDIISELRPSYPDSWKIMIAESDRDTYGDKSRPDDSAEQKIYDMLTLQPLSTQKLSQQLKLSIVELNTLLTQMELNGRIERSGLQWVVSEI